MGKIKKIGNQEINESLFDNTRQYLVGNLKLPQKLSFIGDHDIEIGITSYKSSQAESAHYHTIAKEYQLILKGYTEYIDTVSGQEYCFKKGDFYVIYPNTSYAQKSKKNTEILFIKYPGGNDKVLSKEDDIIASWIKKGIETKRIDHFYSSSSPQPNSIKPAVAVCLTRDHKILLIKRKDSGKWTLPGGTHEFGESLIDTALRETKEEVGFEIEVTRLIGTYTDPNVLVEYNDGEVRQEFTFVYQGEIKSGNLKIDEESTDAKWIDIESVLEYELANSQRRRLEDIIENLKNGEQFLR